MRTLADVMSDIRWASERLHDSQEHAEIVKYEARLKALWDERRKLEQQ